MTPEERQQCSTLRQTAMSASMYDPLSTRYAFKKSCDNIASLGTRSCASVLVVPGEITIGLTFCCNFSRISQTRALEYSLRCRACGGLRTRTPQQQ